MKRIEKLSKLFEDDAKLLETYEENNKKWKPEYGEYYSYIDEGFVFERHWMGYINEIHI